jgi:hypothetical protein
MTRSAPPPVTELTYGQYQGWNCCWCRARLTNGGVSAGVSRGEAGTYVLDIEVYACGPKCPRRPRGAKHTGGDQ